MLENNYEQANRLIHVAEAVNKLPVLVTWDDLVPVGAELDMSEADWAKQLRIAMETATLGQSGLDINNPGRVLIRNNVKVTLNL
jgi:hypothetical protein